MEAWRSSDALRILVVLTEVRRGGGWERFRLMEEEAGGGLVTNRTWKMGTLLEVVEMKTEEGARGAAGFGKVEIHKGGRDMSDRYGG